MNEISSKFKRQIEILGIAINNRNSLSTQDLSEMYGVESLTIKRDLQELRNNGIDIHSEGKKGIRLFGKIDASIIQRLVSSYLALGCIGSSIDKASNLLTKRSGMESLSTVVTLQRCIENTEKVKFKYESEHSQELVEFIVEPLQIFQSEALWRLLAVHNGNVKQFLMTKISAVVPMEEGFKRPPDERIDEIFKHSFLTWTGGEKHTVRLWLSKEMAKRHRSRHLISFETVAEGKDGSVEVSGVVNSLDELAVWVVGLGKGIKALEPKKLRDAIIILAQDAIANYLSK